MNGTLRSEIPADEARGTYPIVYFDDFALEPSDPEIAVPRSLGPKRCKPLSRKPLRLQLRALCCSTVR
jgi:hypothetical protein